MPIFKNNYIGSAEDHEYPDLQVGDEVNPRPFLGVEIYYVQAANSFDPLEMWLLTQSSTTSRNLRGNRKQSFNRGSWVKVTENHHENRMQWVHFGSRHPLRYLLALFSSSRTRPNRADQGNMDNEDSTISEIPKNRACGSKHTPSFRAGWPHAI